MKFRFHRGTLAEAMQTVVEIDPTIAALAVLLGVKNPKLILVEHYCYDSRIGWDTYIVTVDRKAVGFTDSPVPLK